MTANNEIEVRVHQKVVGLAKAKRELQELSTIIDSLPPPDDKEDLVEAHGELKKFVSLIERHAEEVALTINHVKLIAQFGLNQMALVLLSECDIDEATDDIRKCVNCYTKFYVEGISATIQ